MRVLRTFLLITVAAMLLSGCRSHKGVSADGSKGSWGQAAGVDYSGEVADAMGRDLVSEARRWIGTPYRYGGADRGGTDCSGLVMAVFRSVCAVKLPRTTVEQKSYCTKIARNKARVGDLMFFGSGKNGGQVSHVGLYIGKGEMIHASSSRGVMVSKVDTGYWGERFRSAGRIDGAYAAWAGTARGAKALKGKGRTTPLPQPDASPAVDSPAPPVSIGEIAYDRLPLPVQAAATEVGTPATIPTGVQASAPSAPTPTSVATGEIDLLDLIINQKVDSVFSTRFMD